MVRVSAVNADPCELRHFAALAERWWDPDGEFGALHDINPLRLAYIRDRTCLVDRHVLDVGCGGGLLSEALAAAGARVTAIDLEPGALAAATIHARRAGRLITFRRISAEELAYQQPAGFDIVTCMELLEHLPEPAAVVAACARLVKPGGAIFFATLNRTWLCGVLAIVVAERLLHIVASGTHHYRRLVRPVELTRWAAAAGLERRDLTGLQYLPVVRRAWLGGPPAMNYLMHFVRPTMSSRSP
jgi:2-polyprenyl-6-hydroxyphenyl methylase/3-demethylubiquinone-9 3-methyltransferase